MAATDDAKPKRVRTGCLTCRERHLKCDEGLPECVNCRKSSRICKRGVRLNFIDTQVKDPPFLPISYPWKVAFEDESRAIASEYQGGSARYAALETPSPPAKSLQSPPIPVTANSLANAIPSPSLPQPLPPIDAKITINPVSSDAGTPSVNGNESRRSSRIHASSGSISISEPQPATEIRSLLNKPEETLFMQVFIEEVGCWMDSMDPYKHFSRLLPFHSLSEPMLLNAFLACGARHLISVNPNYSEERAVHYYDTATRLLLESLQNPNRDIVITATTSVVLNVYEIMCERALQRMNHIAGARALIKECGWNARSSGIGGACFWINVTMELLSCLHFNWTIAWDPDAWGVNMDFTQDCEPGHEELWCYRMIYLLAKIANFRSSIPNFSENTDYAYINAKTSERYDEWRYLREQCDSWNQNIPRNMHPMAYLYPQQTSGKSAFPEIWLVKRVVIISRLFYHTAMVLLAQINPMMARDLKEMSELAALHSHQICGIVAQQKDRGTASVALRSLAIAAECLMDRREQEEVLEILSRIKRETGWGVNFLFVELKEKWGWQPDPAQQPNPAPPTSLLTTTLLNHAPSSVAPPAGFTHNTASFSSSQVAMPAPKRPARRYPMTNPLQAATSLDFSTRASEQAHPYYPKYVHATQTAHQHEQMHRQYF